MKIFSGIAFAVATLLLVSSCSETGPSGDSRAGVENAHLSEKAKAKPASGKKAKTATAAEAKALADAKSPRQCKTPRQQCGYGAGPAGEPCSCWSNEGSPAMGVTVK
ncbi:MULTISPECIES: hypothetical protein [Ensifer]|jgi:hypothetical protein|uniref:Uncharacterized protein n=1 Tax=Ensifer canadensis TaxID=555315 RepID=A0AAW4FIX1_9HYPH|nr:MULTISPECIES: hypothetical protein [Ensifer]MDP9633735.1 hypothetical protein [Ensifer adhaerens]KQU93645.1 hypothetical protein ASD00_23480 [Ensifer sp. Root31]KQW74339.1 hypothetical protein ASD03_07155 [Ensifer sp. Root127]KQY78672.1 hypothetical protein ASD52_02180 [Ensifer sp. Root142]KRC67469.1 hypothetical protein ASE32_09960 [Ensifer sp. Root231]